MRAKQREQLSAQIEESERRKKEKKLQERLSDEKIELERQCMEEEAKLRNYKRRCAAVLVCYFALFEFCTFLFSSEINFCSPKTMQAPIAL